MKPGATPATPSRGTGRFILGFGPEGTCGDVDLLLEVHPGPETAVTIEWSVPEGCVPAEARARIVSYLEWYLEDYLSKEPVGSLRVDVVAAGWGEERRNEPERAAFLAIREAMTNAKLPPRDLFEPPSADESPEKSASQIHQVGVGDPAVVEGRADQGRGNALPGQVAEVVRAGHAPADDPLHARHRLEFPDAPAGADPRQVEVDDPPGTGVDGEREQLARVLCPPEGQGRDHGAAFAEVEAEGDPIRPGLADDPGQRPGPGHGLQAGHEDRGPGVQEGRHARTVAEPCVEPKLQAEAGQ